MKTLLILAATSSLVLAPFPAPRQEIAPVNPPARALQSPSGCVLPKDSAAYVPGIDAKGRPVASADLPGSSADAEISTEVYAELPSNNPKLPSVGVIANLPGLEPLPLCPPRPASPRR